MTIAASAAQRAVVSSHHCQWRINSTVWSRVRDVFLRTTSSTGTLRHWRRLSDGYRRGESNRSCAVNHYRHINCLTFTNSGRRPLELWLGDDKRCAEVRVSSSQAAWDLRQLMIITGETARRRQFSLRACWRPSSNYPPPKTGSGCNLSRCCQTVYQYNQCTASAGGKKALTQQPRKWMTAAGHRHSKAGVRRKNRCPSISCSSI